MGHEVGGVARAAGVGRALLSLLVAAVGLTGCVANSSNPAVRVVGAVADASRAAFDLEISNPGGRALTVERVVCEVGQGESAFPVGRAEWRGAMDLPSKSRRVLRLDAAIDPASPEAGSKLFHLNGEVGLADRTGYLGLRSMDLTRTSFQASVEAKEGHP